MDFVDEIQEEHSTQPTDVDVVLEPVGGDRESLVELAHTLLAEVNGQLVQIEGAVAHCDVETLAQVAHSLKGAAASTAAEPTCQAACQLEIMGRDGNLDDAPGVLAPLKRAIEDLNAFMANMG